MLLNNAPAQENIRALHLHIKGLPEKRSGQKREPPPYPSPPHIHNAPIATARIPTKNLRPQQEYPRTTYVSIITPSAARQLGVRKSCPVSTWGRVLHALQGLDGGHTDALHGFWFNLASVLPVKLCPRDIRIPGFLQKCIDGCQITRGSAGVLPLGFYCYPRIEGTILTCPWHALKIPCVISTILSKRCEFLQTPW